MEFNLKTGLTCERKEAVTENNVASNYGSGIVAVYSTPAMVGLMEGAALSCVGPLLPEGWSTVGMSLDVKHLAATPIGMTARATAELTVIEGKKLVFKVEAFDDKEKIGEGIHERYIIDMKKFMAKIDEKAKG